MHRRGLLRKTVRVFAAPHVFFGKLLCTAYHLIHCSGLFRSIPFIHGSLFALYAWQLHQPTNHNTSCTCLFASSQFISLLSRSTAFQFHFCRMQFTRFQYFLCSPFGHRLRLGTMAQFNAHTFGMLPLCPALCNPFPSVILLVAPALWHSPQHPSCFLLLLL